MDTYSDAYEDNLACSSCPLGANTNGATGASSAAACECEAANGMVPDGFACSCQPGFFYKSIENRSAFVHLVGIGADATTSIGG